jgi:hydroxypyruvate reductase
MLDAQRRDLFAIYTQALRAVLGQQVVCEHLRTRPAARPVYLVAVGKAAAAMAAGAFAAYGEAVHSAVVITRHGHAPKATQREPRTRYLEAGHPQPDAASLGAGQALLEFISAIPVTAQCLVLISGGASALVEVLPSGVTLADWQRVNAWLLGSGLDIRAMNVVRSALSCIKGGRLVHALSAHHTEVLLLSDVPGDDPRVIGSGLLCPDEDALIILREIALPDWVGKLLHAAPRAPTRDDPRFASIYTTIVANNAMARSAAAEAARSLGYAAYNHANEVVGDVATVARNICGYLSSAPPGVYLWGGETTLKLPPQTGCGGRNQHLALECAVHLQGRNDIVLMAAGTDGSDGVTHNTGAIVDGETIERGRRCGINALLSLANADAATFLDAANDTIRTGPTGTNVMDVIIAIRLKERGIPF